MTDKDSQKDLSDFSMIGLFRMEAESQAAILNEGLLALEENPEAAENLESLMRASHSIKGAARIVQLDTAVTLAHAMEDCFVAAQDGKIILTEAHIDVLLTCVDFFTKISTLGENDIEGWLTENEPEIEKAVQSLSQVQPENAPVEAEVPEPPAGASAAPAEEPEPVVEPAQPPKKPTQDRDVSVRVTAEKLNRLMGLAGEALVEVGRLQSIGDALFSLKKNLSDVSGVLNTIRESTETLEKNHPAKDLLNKIQRKFSECSTTLSDRMTDFDLHFRRMDNFSNRLHHEVVSCRMRPFGDGTLGFPRMVRDVSKKMGKKVKLEITGKDTDVDRDMLVKLEAPLTHLLRNAIDHGIEYPEVRSAAGKSETGTIRLIARHWAGMLYITVSDDGNGIDIEHLREKVVKRNLANAAMAKTLSDVELIEFMFLPGFSTASAVTEISGRGVGLDVVQNMVQEVQGVVRSETSPGKGTRFHLQLPITLSVIRALLVEIGDEPYALPMVRIDRILSVPREEIQVLENRQYITFDNNNIGLVSARQVLGLGDVGLEAETLPVVVIGDRLNQFGIVVDRFIGEKELVINPLDPRLGKVPDINATALLEDGSPVLLIDVEDMVRSIDNLLNGGWLQRVGLGAKKHAEQKRKRVLVVDDSITVREVERRLLETNGYEVEIAVDGADGWNAVRTGRYDMVISDVDMPRMNGIELVTLIKQDARLKNLPVMIVSYKDREEDRTRGLEAGADYYLTKSSFHDNTLLDAVVNLIGEADA